jgi:hypothetical protein
VIIGISTQGNGNTILRASRNGHIKGSFARGELKYRNHHVAALVNKNTDLEGFNRIYHFRGI